MSGENWIDVSIFFASLLVLTLASLVDASLARRQRLTIRDLLDDESNSSGADGSFDQSAMIRPAMITLSLVSILIASIAATRFALRNYGTEGIVVVLVACLIAIAVLGRMLPVILVERHHLADSSTVERLGNTLAMFVVPVTAIAETGIALFDRRPSDTHGHVDTERERYDPGSNGDPTLAELLEDEHEMISGILSMEEVAAREIMVPRPDVIAVQSDMSIADVVRVAQQGGHSRIPVYGESVDQILGIIYVKDLLRFVVDDSADVRLADLMRPAVYVPESKRVDDLLRELRRSRVHIAVVIDEYGGTAGIVTIEDILEEIVGEIQDEYDRESPLYSFVSQGEMTVDGRMSVEELSELVGVTLPETESETLGGFVQRQLGHIPEAGEVVETESLAITVESVERRRVRSLRVRMRDEPQQFDPRDPIQVT